MDSLLKLVAIATVADVVPLTGENRVIVKRGLSGLDRVANPGLRALLDVAGIEAGTSPSARQVAFQIAPRINAAGRMASANDIIDLFTTSDAARARAIAAQLDELNKDRRETEDGIRQAILEQCLAQPVTDGDAALVFAGEGWHRGVVGIVASRVVERYHRPAFVLGLDDGVAYGSGRSIRAFHLLDALESMPDLFTKFGGHRQAAGVTLDAARVEEFRERFRAFAAARLTVADFEPEIEIDAEIGFDEITDQTVAELLNLAPFRIRQCASDVGGARRGGCGAAGYQERQAPVLASQIARAKYCAPRPGISRNAPRSSRRARPSTWRCSSKTTLIPRRAVTRHGRPSCAM